LQPWEEAQANQTAVPFEKQYYIRDTEQPILKQNVGMFKLRSGAEVHFQSFGIFNLDLWDDVIKKFMPLTKKDIIFVGKYSPYSPFTSRLYPSIRCLAAAIERHPTMPLYCGISSLQVKES